MTDHGNGIGVLREVRAKFARPDQMQDAVGRLSVAGFDRADLSLPTDRPESLDVSPKPASTAEDAQQMRTLGASTAASVAAVAAVGITVATGGAAAPAAVVALAAGGIVGGAAYAAQGSANHAEQRDRDTRAASGDLVLAVRAATDAKQFDAATILREAGGVQIEIIGQEA
jgi:hypothetical protein